ncbi:hypothetical protein niasHT_012343 [Heterodera trifolii]|uniref:Uncharacterized protein n=1 Tax=Heterodera trifolii TaxID=157864 RepID=A0ABD2L7B2_9BILA
MHFSMPLLLLFVGNNFCDGMFNWTKKKKVSTNLSLGDQTTNDDAPPYFPTLESSNQYWESSLSLQQPGSSSSQPAKAPKKSNNGRTSKSNLVPDQSGYNVHGDDPNNYNPPPVDYGYSFPTYGQPSTYAHGDHSNQFYPQQSTGYNNSVPNQSNQYYQQPSGYGNAPAFNYGYGTVPGVDRVEWHSERQQ